MILSLRLRTSLVRCIALVLVVVLGACFSYVPAAGPSQQGQRVRVFLDDPAAFRLTDVTAENIVTITGEVVQTTDDELVLSAWELEGASGYEHSAAGETVRVERNNIQRAERYRISAFRSALLFGSLVAVGVLFIGLVGSGDGGERDNGGQPPPR